MRSTKKITAFILSIVILLSCAVCSITSFANPVETSTDIEAPSQEEPKVDDNTSGIFIIDTEKDPISCRYDTKEITVFKASVNIDLNDDGKFSVVDARLILRIAVRLDVTDLPTEKIDFNGDGKISALDARAALRFATSLEAYYFPADMSSLDGILTLDNGKMLLMKKNAVSTGFYMSEGFTYYFDGTKGMVKGLITIDGSTYYFDEDGQAYSGKITLNGNSYLFENGKAFTGEYNEGGKKYFYNADGTMKTSGTLTLGGVLYRFGKDGVATPGKDPSKYKIAMIGDSTVLNMYNYNPTDRIDFYGKVSLHANGIFTKKVSGSSIPIIDEIKGRGYDVVIVHVGVNDLGGSESAWGETYRSILKGVKSRTPDAIIYASAVLPVNESVARRNGYSCTNAQIGTRNKTILKIATEEGVNYLDATSYLAPSGQLPSTYASDGIHFYGSACKLWADWMLAVICQ